MKKALTFMLIGALSYGVVDMLVNNGCNSITRKMKKLKRNGMEAYNKVKAIF